MSSLFKLTGIMCLIFVFAMDLTCECQQGQAGSALPASSTWIGRAEIPLDNSNKIFKEQAIAMRIEQTQAESVRATLWPTQPLLLRLEGELNKENRLRLRVVEVSRKKDGPLVGTVWQKEIIFDGRITGDKIEGTIRWPPREGGVVLQGKFVLKLVK